MTEQLATIVHVEGMEYKTLPIEMLSVSVTAIQWACNLIEEAGDTASIVICSVDDMAFKPHAESVGRKLTILFLPDTVIHRGSWAVAGTKTVVWNKGI